MNKFKTVFLQNCVIQKRSAVGRYTKICSSMKKKTLPAYTIDVIRVRPCGPRAEPLLPLTRHIKQFWNCSVDMKQLSLRQHADFFRTATISDGKRLIRAQKG